MASHHVDDSLAPGTHLVSMRKHGVYTHHGLYVGRGAIIHYSGFSKGLEGGEIERITLDDFAQGVGYDLKTYKNPKYTAAEAVTRAEIRLANREKEIYSLSTNNCEHFCAWCITGSHTSAQVSKIFNLILARVTKTVMDTLKKRLPAPSPVVAMAGMAEASASIYKYLHGDIDSQQLSEALRHSAVRNAGVFYYSVLGQATIPVPVIGALIGASVGYVLGNMLCQSGLVALGESDVARASRQRREMIESLCAESIVCQQQHREALEALLNQHFATRQQVFLEAFSTFEQSLTAWDADEMVVGLEAINQAFDSSLPFASFTEFKGFMQDKKEVFVL